MNCPYCESEDTTKISTSQEIFQCRDCGEKYCDTAADHFELLQDLTENDDPAIAALGESILNYTGGA